MVPSGVLKVRVSGFLGSPLARSMAPAVSTSLVLLRLPRKRDALVALVGEPYGRGPNGHVLVRGPTMTCVSVGNGGGDRTAAWCVSPRGVDLSYAMVASGTALRWDRYWAGPSLSVISDWEIWACANHYITKHGEDAPIIAAMRADELMSECDMQGARTFQMIVKRINQLLEPPSGPLH